MAIKGKLLEGVKRDMYMIRIDLNNGNDEHLFHQSRFKEIQVGCGCRSSEIVDSFQERVYSFCGSVQLALIYGKCSVIAIIRKVISRHDT